MYHVTELTHDKLSTILLLFLLVFLFKLTHCIILIIITYNNMKLCPPCYILTTSCNLYGTVTYPMRYEKEKWYRRRRLPESKHRLFQRSNRKRRIGKYWAKKLLINATFWLTNKTHAVFILFYCRVRRIRALLRFASVFVYVSLPNGIYIY